MLYASVCVFSSNHKQLGSSGTHIKHMVWHTNYLATVPMKLPKWESLSIFWILLGNQDLIEISINILFTIGAREMNLMSYSHDPCNWVFWNVKNHARRNTTILTRKQLCDITSISNEFPSVWNDFATTLNSGRFLWKFNNW